MNIETESKINLLLNFIQRVVTKLACAIQNAAAKTATNACFLLAKWILSDLVGQRPSSSIINFEEVKNFFLVWNFYFTFFLPVVDCTFLQEHRKVTSWKYGWSNIAQTNSLWYVVGFYTPTLMKMCSIKEVYINISKRYSF